MKMTLDSAAVNLVHELRGEYSGQLRLIYDLEGCGCGMSGIAGLELVDKPGMHDISIECDSFPVWIDRGQAVFYEDKLFLKGDESTGTFRLDGMSQLYHSNLRLVDRRQEVSQK